MNKIGINRLLLSLAIVLPVLALVLELVNGVTISDSSVFRYIGWKMASSGGSYVHAWDNKGPMLIFFNALGYWMLPRGDIGPTVVFAGLWIASLLMIYRLLRSVGSIAGGHAALLFSVIGIGIGGLQFLNCEEIVAVFFALSGILCWRYVQSPACSSFLLGFCVGGPFMMKPNLVAFGGAAGLFWLIEAVRTRDWKTFFIRAFASFCGFVLMLSVVTLLYYPDGMKPMWDATLLYGLFEFRKGGPGWVSWWTHYLRNWSLTVPGAWILPVFAVTFTCASLLAAVMRRAAEKKFVLYLSLWMALETAMAFVSSGFYNHYLIGAFVPLAMLIGCAAGVIRAWFFQAGLALGSLGLVALFGMSCYSGFRFALRRNVELREVKSFVNSTIGSGTRVATAGALPVAELLGSCRLDSRQKYFSWILYEIDGGEKRKVALHEEFTAALRDPEVKWFIGDVSNGWMYEKIAEKNPEMQTALAAFKLVKQTPTYKIYRKR